MMNKHKQTKNFIYHWVGIDKNGFKKSGEHFASSKTIVKNNLERQKILPLNIQKHKKNIFSLQCDRFTTKQRLDFTEELYWLLQSGTALTEAIDTIASTYTNTHLKKMLTSIKNTLLSGESFSIGLSAFPMAFDTTYLQLITVGEQTGQLEKMLKQLITHQKTLSTLKSNIMKAMVYPISVFIISIGITIGLLIFVVPQFAHIYQSFGAQLPETTQLLIQISKTLSSHFFLFITLIASSIALIKAIWRYYPQPKKALSQFLLKTPIIKKWITIALIAQWSQIFSTLLNAGTPLIEALTLSSKAVTHSDFQHKMSNVIKQIVSGNSLSDALKNHSYFPERFHQHIRIAESADTLPVVIEKMATAYQHQLNNLLGHLSKLVEPVIMILIASGIAMLIIALYLPIFRMGSIM